MGSGNFLIGKGLSLEGFNLYVQPLFEEKGYSVQDKLVVPYNDHRKSILASVVGEGDLEKGINGLLVESGEIIEKAEAKKEPCHRIAWNQQVSELSHYKDEKDGYVIRVNKGVYETIGSYHYKDIASQMFPLIAQRYLLEEVETKAEEVIEQVKELLGKRLSEL